MNNTNNKKIIASIIILVVVICVGFYFYKRAPVNQKPVSTFSTQPFSGMPVELTPDTKKDPAQFWDNSQATGTLFNVDEPLAKAIIDYKAKFTITGWNIVTENSDDASAVFALMNNTTNQRVDVRMSALPGGKATSITITVLK